MAGLSPGHQPPGSDVLAVSPKQHSARPVAPHPGGGPAQSCARPRTSQVLDLRAKPSVLSSRVRRPPRPSLTTALPLLLGGWSGGVPGAPGFTSESAPTVARPFLFKPATGSRHVAGRRQNVSESRRIPQAREKEEKQGLQVETGEQRPKK